MNTIQSTVYGAKLLVKLLLGHTPEIDENSTMNERLDAAPDLRPTSSEKVYLGVLTVGNRGHKTVIGNGGIALSSILDHYAPNASVFNPVPFCMRPISQDLSEALRGKYALRKELTVGGTTYYAYYGLRMNIDPEAAEVTIKKVTVENNTTIEEIFVPSTSDLYPEPIELPADGAVSTSNVSFIVSCTIRVELTSDDIAEYVNVAKILNGGDERYAIMSEFALCTGADRMITVPSTVGSINFLESIGTQIYSFSSDHKALHYNSQELKLDFDVGNQIPMLGTASIPTVG